MPVQRIQPEDSLNSGFRGKYNETCDAIPTSADLNNGNLQFKNDQGSVIFQVDIDAIFALKSELNGDGSTVNPESASETEEGIGQPATPAEGLAGENQFKWITPAVLAYALANLPAAGGGQRFDLEDPDYDVVTKDCTITLTTITQPELLVTDTGSTQTTWQLATAHPTIPRTWRHTFPGITSSGKLTIRAAGDSMAVGSTVPLRIPETFIPELTDEDN